MKKWVYSIAFIIIYGQTCASENSPSGWGEWSEQQFSSDGNSLNWRKEVLKESESTNLWYDDSEPVIDDDLMVDGDDDTCEKYRQIAGGIYAGVNPNIRNQFDATSLFCAKNVEMAKLLVKNGASVLERTAVGENLLHNVVSRDYAPDLIDYYMSLKVKHDEQDNFGDTPLDMLTVIHSDKCFSFKDYAKAFLASGVTEGELVAAFVKKMPLMQSTKQFRSNGQTFAKMIGAEQREKAFYAMSK